MSKIKLYHYDYAAYFTGQITEIDETQGYQPGYLTTVPVPEIPEGHHAKFNKSLLVWEITTEDRPELVNPQDIINQMNIQAIEEISKQEPQVI